LDCDPGTLASAGGLWSEATLPIKWLAARVQIGTLSNATMLVSILAPPGGALEGQE
jgi:hypothetical protein